MSHEYPDGTLAAEQAERRSMGAADYEFPGPEHMQKYTERDDEATWRDVILPPPPPMPLRESPSYVYAGDSETEETVYLVGPNGEMNPSDELVRAVEAVLAKIHGGESNGYDRIALEDVETDLEHALERYRCRR